MNVLNQIKNQLLEMSETEKDAWILSQAKLLSEREQEGILLSLFGVKKIISMPTSDEIEEFCKRVDDGEIYFEYETHYFEFDSDGRYMDDWDSWHNDVFQVIPFLNRIFSGCHDLLRLDECAEVARILGKVCELSFSLEQAEDSEDYPADERFSLTDADREGMFSGKLCDVGEDWIRAVTRLTKGQEDSERIQKLLKIFEHPVCEKVKPRILMEEGVSWEMFTAMAGILEHEIDGLEVLREEKIRKITFDHEIYELQRRIDRKKEMLLDIRVKCLKTMSSGGCQSVSRLEACWKQIQEGIHWLSYEYIDDQPEIDEIHDICEALIRDDQLNQEDWEVRRQVLSDIIHNQYYDYYSCGDVMEELADKLCTSKDEYLACADIMDNSKDYKEKAAYLYYKYGKDDKYISYLENHLDRRSKEYSALITYYQEHGRQEDACRIAELGLERCKEDLTDCFICLLKDVQKNGDQKQFQKLYASAKRRKYADIVKIDTALEGMD